MTPKTAMFGELVLPRALAALPPESRPRWEVLCEEGPNRDNIAEFVDSLGELTMQYVYRTLRRDEHFQADQARIAIYALRQSLCEGWGR